MTNNSSRQPATRRTRLAAGAAAIFAVTLVAATTASAIMGARTTFITFSGAVALPGVTLPAGAYTFEIANPNARGDVVLVRTRHTNRVHFMGFTRLVERPSTMPENQLIELGEARRGEPVPIRAWYPGGRTGYEFIYR